MNDEFISKLARYVAFLYREVDIWHRQYYSEVDLDVLTSKIETAKDICAMLGCRDKVWSEATKIYDVTKEG